MRRDPHAMTGTELRVGSAADTRTKTLSARPRCAVCGKPVEEFTEDEGYLDRFVVFTARCHGQSERVWIELTVVKAGAINFGLAFVPSNALAAPETPKQLAAVAGAKDSR